MKLTTHQSVLTEIYKKTPPQAAEYIFFLTFKILRKTTRAILQTQYL